MKYTIEGGQLPVLNLELEPGESVVTEAGGMSWMSANMKMTTSSGGFGKAMGRLFSGETLFLNEYKAEGTSGTISLSNALPGSILPIEISPNMSFIAQKGSFLAAEKGVELSVFFRKKFGAGLVGGEGFIMQKLTGQGLAFIEVDGSLIIKNLVAGEQLIVSTGYVAAMEGTVSMDVRTVGSVKNALFGGEGIFNTVLTGPGRVYLQSTPFFELLKRIPPTNR